MFSRHGPRTPSGWVQAPDSVKEEILLVWQEDEMPEEVKNAPGYVPFTLSPVSEDWLSGMAEIKELQDSDQTMIIGRPGPPVTRQRRSLIPTPAASPESSVDAPATPPSVPAPVTHVSTKEWVRRQAPRNVPAIAEHDAPAPAPAPVQPRSEGARSLPDIGGEPSSTPPRERPRESVRSAPQIGDHDSAPDVSAPAKEHSETPRQVPQIGPADEAR